MLSNMLFFEQLMTLTISFYHLDLARKSHTFSYFSIKEEDQCNNLYKSQCMACNNCVSVPIYTNVYDGI